ncbi:MAG: dienelactone hydrolase family protein [Pseudomonadota bacterium]
MRGILHVLAGVLRACLALVLFAGGAAAQYDIFIGDVPLPGDVAVADSIEGTLSGVWIGRWNTGRHHILVVEEIGEEIGEDGRADVVYAVGRDWSNGGNWLRTEATVAGDVLTITEGPFRVRYMLSPTGRLRGVLREDERFAILERVDLSEPLASTSARGTFAVGDSYTLETDLVEDGRRIDLEAVVYRPPGEGPFPLALVHHGSTGDGRRPDRFDEVWTNDWLGDLLNEHGWIAAFPQRRGRGGSDGLYDEGFADDRTEGYAPDAARSLPGAERALGDANAALAALRDWPDVAPGPVLLGGASRGGVVAIMQAGADSEGTAGVLNFVGGWTSEGWGEATINPILFRRIESFDGPILSIYGEDDPFYSVAHSRANLEEFEARRATSQLHVVEVPGFQNGHWVLSTPTLWDDVVREFLGALSE